MLSYQPYREAGHSQTYRTACNFIQTLTPNPATVSEDASGLVCIKVGGIFFSSASRKVMAYPTDCARFPWQVEGREMPLGTLSRENRDRWKAGRCHLEHFRGETVAGGRQGKTPGTLLRENRARWTARRDTWNTFAGKPCQVDSGKGHLTCFRGKTVAGGRQGKTPGTLLQEFRDRWTAGKATWNTFAGIPCQVDGKKRHLEHFCGKTVAGGRQGKTPGTLLQEFRDRWTAGKATWNTFAGIPCQVDGETDGKASFFIKFAGNHTQL